MKFSVRYLRQQQGMYSMYLQLPNGVKTADAVSAIPSVAAKLSAIYEPDDVATKLTTVFQGAIVDGKLRPFNTISQETLLTPDKIETWVQGGNPVWFSYGRYGVAVDLNEPSIAKALYWILYNPQPLSIPEDAFFEMTTEASLLSIGGAILTPTAYQRVPQIVQFANNLVASIKIIFPALGIDPEGSGDYAIDIADLPISTGVVQQLQQSYQAVHPQERKQVEQGASFFWWLVKWTAISVGGYYGIKYIWNNFIALEEEEEEEVIIRLPKGRVSTRKKK